MSEKSVHAPKNSLHMVCMDPKKSVHQVCLCFKSDWFPRNSIKERVEADVPDTSIAPKHYLHITSMIYTQKYAECMHIIRIHSALSVHLHTRCILFWQFLISLHKVCIKCLHKVCICRLNAHSLSLRSLNLAYALKSAKNLHYCLHQVCNCRLHAH